MQNTEQEQIKQLSNAVQELLGIVCGMAGVLAQIPAVHEIDVNKAVANGKALIPPFVSSATHTAAMKAVSSIVAQAKMSQS